MAQEAILIAKEDILLPYLEDGLETPEWIRVKKLKHPKIQTDVLIQKNDKCYITDYSLYGVCIPVRFPIYTFSYKPRKPDLEKCVGVKCKPSDIIPGARTNYLSGTKLTDELVISWLEKEKNIETMRSIIGYLEEYEIKMNQRKKEQEEKIKMQEEKDKLLQKRKDELVKQYNPKGLN